MNTGAGHELPSSWSRAPLRDLLETLESGSRPKGGVKHIESGVPSLGGEHLDSSGGFRFERIKFVPVEFAKRMTRGRVRKGDILVVKDGATTGKTSLVRDSFPFDVAVVNEHVFLCRCKEGIDSRYVFYYLFSSKGRDEILQDFRGAAQGGISQRFVELVRVPLAALDQQKRIVAEIEKQFSRLDEAVASLKRVKANLKRYKASVLKAAVEGKLTEEWRKQHPDVEPASKLLERILCERRAKWNGTGKYEEPAQPDMNNLTVLPNGWAWCLTDALLSFVTSGSRGWARYYSEDGPVFLRVGNLDHDSIRLDLKDIQRVKPPKGAEGMRTKVKSGDILVSITADVGMIAVAPTSLGEAYINQHVALARPVPWICREYLAWYLAAHDGGQKQFRRLQRGATKIGLGLDDIRAVPVPLPPLAEQEYIVAEVERRLSVIEELDDAVDANLTRAERLRQSILNNAFSGKLKIKKPAVKYA